MKQKQYIDKDALIAEIERLRREDGNPYFPSETADKYYARGVHFTCDGLVNFLNNLESEEVNLEKETEDEKVKRILHSISSKISFHLRDIFTEEEFQCFDAWSNDWLKKQDEQKPTDMTESKFRKGDWVVREYEYTDIITINQVVDVKRIDDEFFGYTLDDGTYFSGSLENSYHLWTIQDAKDGDILVGSKGSVILMFRGIGNTEWDDVIDYHCYYDCYHEDFVVQEGIEYWGNTKNNQLKPATKEQRDFLFQKMKEVGYMWDAEKIENKPLVIDEGKAEMDHCFTKMMNGEKINTAWGEEDELHIRELESLVKKVWVIAEHENDKKTIHKMSDLSFFLKTLKPQLKQEWSEEDEAKLKSTCALIRNTSLNGNERVVDSTITWLKSLKERIKGE